MAHFLKHIFDNLVLFPDHHTYTNEIIIDLFDLNSFIQAVLNYWGHEFHFFLIYYFINKGGGVKDKFEDDNVGMMLSGPVYENMVVCHTI